MRCGARGAVLNMQQYAVPQDIASRIGVKTTQDNTRRRKTPQLNASDANEPNKCPFHSFHLTSSQQT